MLNYRAAGQEGKRRQTNRAGRTRFPRPFSRAVQTQRSSPPRCGPGHRGARPPTNGSFRQVVTG
eukprot:COSAG02_NODE_42822_length_381_cov_0.507092_1_plen_63_part_01